MEEEGGWRRKRGKMGGKKKTRKLEIDVIHKSENTKRETPIHKGEQKATSSKSRYTVLQRSLSNAVVLLPDPQRPSLGENKRRHPGI